MIKSKIATLFFTLVVVAFVTSCNNENNSGLNESITELQTNQKNIQEQIVQINALQSNQQGILKKIQTMDKSITNLTAANKNRPSKTQQPKSDPNKVYSVKIGNSFVQGNKNAKVTIIEWADYF